ncbi:MAG TPA: PAS domain S-box protein [Myxococcales bacterium]|jgi:PAS domain S-box-containing protein
MASDDDARGPDGLEPGERRWKSLFDCAPIPIWEEDFSAVRRRFDELRAAGVEDLAGYCAQHPQEFEHLASLVRVVAVSDSTAAFLGLRSKDEVPRRLTEIFDEKSLEVFAREMSALWRGETSFEAEGEICGPGGARRVVALRLSVAPGFERTLSRVVVSFLDVTELARQREATRENSERLDLFFSLALDLLCIIDAQGRFLRLSQAWEGTLDYRLDELLGKSFIDLVHPEDVAATRVAFANLKGGKSLLCFVNRYRRRDGTYRWLEWRSSPFFGSFLYATARDITDRRRVEESSLAHLRFLKDLERFDRALRESDDLERMMEAGLDAALSIFGSDRIWLVYPCDPDAPSWTVLMERTRAEYPGAFAQRAVVPMMPDAREVLRLALASEGPVAFDSCSGRSLEQAAERFSVRSQIVLAVHPKLGKPWLLGMHQCSRARVWDDEDQRLFLEIGRRLADALSSLLLLKDLRESEEKHKRLIETTDTGYVILDVEGRVTDANLMYLRLTGRPALEEILGVAAAAWTAPGDRQRWAAAIAQCLELGQVRNLELDFVGPDGRATPVEINASRLSTPKATRLMAVCRDITERRHAEDGLREAARRKDDFLAMLGHELRNPLAPIRNAIHLLQRTGSPDPRARKAEEIIERQTAHLARIVDDLLDVSRIARGKVGLRKERLDWAAVVRHAAEDYRANLAAKGIEMTVALPDAPVWVEGDPTRLVQVLGNLLHNSEKFTKPGGRVMLDLRAEERSAVLTVADTGIGMSAATLERLFEPFAQAGTDLARSRGGLGLGLALVRGLLELHGGTVRATSEGLGRGSRFTVVLPLRQAPPPPRQGVAVAAAAPRAGIRVLIIEDNRDAAESLQALLELQGHRVRVAGDGVAGLRAARAFLPDAVLCDIGLPGELDGYGVARAVRADPRLRSVLLIAISGYGQHEDKERAAAASFDLHLTKPVEPDALEKVLRAARHEGEPPPAFPA